MRARLACRRRREEALLRQADAVFAGDGAAELEGKVEDLGHGLLDAVHLVGVARR